jgi:hypothetical protein
MKNKVMHCLKDSNLGKIEKYNKLVDFLSQKKNSLQLRMFNLGYSDARMDVLVAEVKKAYEIKDLDLYKFNVEDYEKQLQEKEQEVPENTGTENSKEPETELSEQETKFLEALKQNEDATAGLKLREEYPFLREESTPQELKALVTDKITAWYDFAEKHEKLAKMVENSGNTISENGEPDPLAVLCKEAIDKFQLNADIKKELDFYKEKGKVLGIVPQTKFLKIDQELNDMDPAELVEHRMAAQKNKNKVKNPKNDNEKARFENWTYREKKAAELLDTKFKK